MHTKTAFALAFAGLLGTLTVGCAANTGSDTDVSANEDNLRVVDSFVSRGTGYYPDSSALEGGFVDMRGAKLRTLQQFLRGDASYVAVAMDKSEFAYGTRLRIAELNAKYGQEIIFRVVDTGSAFTGKGQSRMDICTQNRSASLDPVINGRLHVEVINERLAPAPPAEPVSDPQPSGREGAGASSANNGNVCSSDGDCNPGDNGSGLICKSGKCVDGCRTDAQCPGVTTCESGLCR
jgi:3D (Asp-Asp-Asp) domain-containing protein